MPEAMIRAGGLSLSVRDTCGSHTFELGQAVHGWLLRAVGDEDRVLLVTMMTVEVDPSVPTTFNRVKPMVVVRGVERKIAVPSGWASHCSARSRSSRRGPRQWAT